MNSRGRRRYFCENCGAEVPLKAKRCPGCGRFFESVRCPSCGFTGEESRFAKGCPICGHAVTGGAKYPHRNGAERPPPLPLWVYLVSAAALAGVFALLFFRFV
ncbi:MAG: zinc ribbon domain-containing protein [Spirochaetaceae bacterium]|jgi:predicted amidophosphoribosyltransferase|nr:zinc ribbon domain-containing protein [Spirochaetaceae bacterium]